MGGCEIIKEHADYRLMSKKAVNALGCFEETNLFLRGIVPLVDINPVRYILMSIQENMENQSIP